MNLEQDETILEQNEVNVLDEKKIIRNNPIGRFKNTLITLLLLDLKPKNKKDTLIEKNTDTKEINLVIEELQKKWAEERSRKQAEREKFDKLLDDLIKENVKRGEDNMAILVSTKDQEKFEQLEEDRVRRRREELSKFMGKQFGE